MRLVTASADKSVIVWSPEDSGIWMPRVLKLIFIVGKSRRLWWKCLGLLRSLPQPRNHRKFFENYSPWLPWLVTRMARVHGTKYPFCLNIS